MFMNVQASHDHPPVAGGDTVLEEIRSILGAITGMASTGCLVTMVGGGGRIRVDCFIGLLWNGFTGLTVLLLGLLRFCIACIHFRSTNKNKDKDSKDNTCAFVGEGVELLSPSSMYPSNISSAFIIYSHRAFMLSNIAFKCSK